MDHPRLCASGILVLAIAISRSLATRQTSWKRAGPTARKDARPFSSAGRPPFKRRLIRRRSRHTFSLGMSLAVRRTLLLAAALQGADPLAATEAPSLHGVVDVRAIRTDRARSWLDGGLGK